MLDVSEPADPGALLQEDRIPSMEGLAGTLQKMRVQLPAPPSMPEQRGVMEPEREDGNTEYKLKLMDESCARVQRLASQMRYRCNEGGSECIYRLGVEDDGTMSGLTEAEYESTLRCLKSAAAINSYSVHSLCRIPVSGDKSVYEVNIREDNDDTYIDVKVAIAGSVDCGKSTLLSVLTNGQPDNGRGAARLAVFNFAHEVESGRTSSIGHRILGYDSAGQVMNYQQKRIYAWPEVVKRSSKIISFYDLAGHEKYLKTTIFGLSCSQPDACLIMVGGNRGVLRMTLEHMFLCKTLNIPFGVVVTKVDMMKDKQNVLDETLTSITTLLKKPGMRRHPVKVKSQADIVRCAQNLHSESIVPIFQVSNVTMEGMPELHAFLNLLPKRVTPTSTDEVEVHLDASWTVTGVGTVLGGHLMSGSVSVGDKLWFGPTQNQYVQIVVRTIQCKRVALQKVSGNSYICLGVKGVVKKDVHKGNVLVSSRKQQVLCTRLRADVQVLKMHSTTIRVGYEPILHSANVRASVAIDDIIHKVSARASATQEGRQDATTHDDGATGAADTGAAGEHGPTQGGAPARASAERKFLATGDTAEVMLRIKYGYKVFIKPGNHVLLCEGRTKVVGVVKETYED